MVKDNQGKAAAVSKYSRTNAQSSPQAAAAMPRPHAQLHTVGYKLLLATQGLSSHYDTCVARMIATQLSLQKLSVQGRKT